MDCAENLSSSLPDLLEQLTCAVGAKDYPRAQAIERLILQKLGLQAQQQAVTERTVRELMATLGSALASESIAATASLGEGPLVVSYDDLPAAHSPLRRGFEKAVVKTTPTSSAEIRVVYPVWFGTNRKPLQNGTGFGPERHASVTHGRVDVYVPKAHRFGETGSSFWQRLMRLDLRDDHLKVEKVSVLSHADAVREIQTATQAARDAGEAAHALFFLHGYKTTFEEAALRAAQIGVDLKVPGATAFFSWPSRGNVAAYTVDEASIEASESAITDFLVDFTSRCGAERVHIIAHSMGNRGLLRALQRVAGDAEARSKLKVSQIFLAAPDVDRDLFVDLARVYEASGAERTTLYASDADLPVHLSSKIHDAPRAGYFTPYTVAPKIDTVAVPNFDVDLLGHSYFAEAEALLYDIGNLMRRDEAPGKRQRVTTDENAGQRFWRLVR